MKSRLAGAGPRACLRRAAIAPVIAKLEAIAAQLDEGDGVARFNELYLAVTRAVAGRTAADTFEDA